MQHLLRKMAIGGALAATTITGGALGATLLGTANADSGSGTTSSSAPAASTATPAPAAMPAHGSAEHEAQEKPVTGDAATQAQAAAVKSIGSGTAGGVTTDMPGTGYEVTVTKADGTQVEVHLDSSFTVMQGGHHGPGGPGGPNDNDADDAPAASTAG
jgi:hypothetical protein